MAIDKTQLMTQDELYEHLVNRFSSFKSELSSLQDKEVDLEKRPEDGKWNARENFEHLVVMWETYRPQFDRGFEKATHRTHNKFKSGWFGNWFANKMKPIESGGMKTAKMFEPANFSKNSDAINALIEVQDDMIEYLTKMKKVDLQKSKITSPASKMIRMRMGDAFLVLANHQDRHWQHAIRAMN